METTTNLTYNDVQTLKKECLGLLNCMQYFRKDDQFSEAWKLTQNALSLLKKLEIGSIMYNRKLICVSGMQGAGKTTMLRYFYDLTEDFLPSTFGRGESIPVLVTECPVKNAKMYQVKYVEVDGNFQEKKEEIEPKQYLVSASGNDPCVMYLEIEVPYCHTNNSGISFMLLPGFEKENKSLNDLIEFAVNSSDAAIFVFDDQSFSNADNDERIRKIQETFGKNVIYALSWSDKSEDNNQELKQNCQNTLNIPKSEEDRIVCVGAYPNREENEAWIKNLKWALNKYAYYSENRETKNGAYLYENLGDLQMDIYQILGMLDGIEDKVIWKENMYAGWLEAFDRTVAKKRKRFKENLENQMNCSLGEGRQKIINYFAENDRVNGKKLGRVIFGNKVEDQYVRPGEVIEHCLYEQQGNNKHFIADQYIINALESTLNQWRQLEDVQCDGDSAAGSLIDVQETNNKKILVEGEKFRAFESDVVGLLGRQNNGEKRELECKDPQKLLSAVAEFGTYYYSLAFEERIKETIALSKPYEPAEKRLDPDKVKQSAEASKKFAAGMLGIMGIDIIGDGSLNLVSQMAKQLGVAIPVAGVAATMITAGGSWVAIKKDINRMMREDCQSALMTVNEIYSDISDNILDGFDQCMERVKERLAENLSGLDRRGEELVKSYNAKIRINRVLSSIEPLLEKYSGDYTEELI